MNTENKTPSAGAMAAARAIYLADYSTFPPDARIIDQHTNAIADDLAYHLKEMVNHFGCYAQIGVDLQTQVDAVFALARYNAAKSKELK